MRHNDAGDAVRILPDDGFAVDAAPTSPRAPRRWPVPLLVVAGVLAAFVVATRPTSESPETATTQPAPIAAVDADSLDFSTVVTSTVTHEWVSEDLAARGQINDIIRTGSTFVAVGESAEGAHIWVSATGGNWRDIARLESPETLKTSIDHALNWDGGIVALGAVGDGVGLWTAPFPSNWTYRGTIASFDQGWVDDLAAGPELLAVSGSEGQVHGWLSSDGLDWRSLGAITDLDGVLIHGVSGTEDWYFAYGEGDCDPRCGAVIYRSADGVNWDLAANDLGASSRAITNMAATPRGLLATGWVDEPEGTAVAIWESSDGAIWDRLGTDASSLRASSVTIRLLNARPGENPVAEILVSGEEAEVTIGTEISTDAGVATVSEISSSSISLTQSDSSRAIEVIDTSTLTAHAVPNRIAVEGPRVVISGYLLGGDSRVPAVWVSGDRGATWTRKILADGDGNADLVSTAGPHIVVGGSTAQEGMTWRAAWDTDPTGDAAEAVVASYLDALSARDQEALAGLLPKTDDGAIPPEFMVPSLGETRQPWWDSDTGRLDQERIAATLDYLQATNASIDVAECTSGTSLGAVDRVNVRCEFAVDSTLLTLFGTGGAVGYVNALLRNGVLTTVSLDTSPSINMWRILASESEEAGDGAAIEFDATTAAGHYAAAERLLAGVLTPGGTVEVDTPLGAMEWTWTRPPVFGADYLRSISWSDLGFIATGYGDPNSTDSAITAWTSPDGRTWTVVETPDEWGALWGLQAFHEGIIGVAHRQATVLLVYYDGADWTEIPLAQPDEADYLDFARIAVSGDQVMAIAGWWQEDGLLLNEGVIVGTDLTSRVIELPPKDSWEQTNIQLAGSDEGFVLGTSGYFEPNPELSIWHTTDGAEWTLLADKEALGDAQFVWNLQQHRSRYFVVGEGAELRCTTSTQGENCVSLIQLWSSPDGVGWDRVITESGEPVSTYEIGSGPLGLIAFDQPLADSSLPRSVFFSVDGGSWTTTGDLTLLNPDSEWWYLDTPAIGTDTIIAAGSSFDATGSTQQTEEPFLIIGRLLESP